MNDTYADTSEYLYGPDDDYNLPSTRVTIDSLYYADEPDGDGYGYVFRVDHSRTRVQVRLEHADSGDEATGADIADRLEQLLAHQEDGPDWQAVETWARRRLCAVSFDQVDPYDAHVTYLFIVTVDQARAWGCAREDWPTLTSSASHDWRAYIEGDVWQVTIQDRIPRATCSLSASGARCLKCADDCDCTVCHYDAAELTWEDVDYSSTIYGYEYAQQEARAAIGRAA